MSSTLPEKRIRHRSHRDEITVDKIAKVIYQHNPAKPTHHSDEAPGGAYPIEHPFAHAKRALAVQQAMDVYALFQPYTLIHEHRSLPMWERIVKFDQEYTLEDIDRAIQSALEGLWDRHGRRDVTLDSERTWSEIEGIVLLDLDINEGLYWAGVTG